MRKPHWEAEMASVHDMLRSISNGLRIEGPGAGIGPITDCAVIRRVRFIKEMTGSTWAESAVISGKHSYGPNELVGDKAPPGFTSEWVHASAFAGYCMFTKGGERIYKIGREFGDVLRKVDLDVKADLVPEIPYYFCVEFPEHIAFHDHAQSDWFCCAYLAVQKRSEHYKPVDRHGKDLYCTIDIILPCYYSDGRAKPEENNTILAFRDKDEKLSECIDRAQANSTHPINCKEVFEYIVKFLIYLGSGEPDLREYRAPRPTTHDPKKTRRWAREHHNRSLVDMTLVGFSWKKQRPYKVGETTVTGHPRWQPWGPGRTKVKLIWIEPFVRHYKGREIIEEETNG